MFFLAAHGCVFTRADLRVNLKVCAGTGQQQGQRCAVRDFQVRCWGHGVLDLAKAFKFTKVGCFGGQGMRQRCKRMQMPDVPMLLTAVVLCLLLPVKMRDTRLVAGGMVDCGGHGGECELCFCLAF